MSIQMKLTSVFVLVVYAFFLMSSDHGFVASADPNKNISACHFCDDADFSIRNLVCCTWSSRCCGPDRF
ncbi:hypothetical protein JTE90_017890 [Oedothorax gibbosus]|uniref:Uncharacterized protein n=1 Tax=Oedothorax gibbosus TaxID=931172 RepID=A0AAV6V2I3_9ARAC|nr:hypothetical protein JTE90_017890 [Oedothorax gibbosus]